MFALPARLRFQDIDRANTEGNQDIAHRRAVAQCNDGGLGRDQCAQVLADEAVAVHQRLLCLQQGLGKVGAAAFQQPGNVGDGGDRRMHAADLAS